MRRDALVLVGGNSAVMREMVEMARACILELAMEFVVGDAGLAGLEEIAGFR